MTKLTKKRIEIIHHVMKNYGIEWEEYIIIDEWSLAYTINNIWKAKCFVNTGRVPNAHRDYRKYTVNDFALYELFRAIRDAVSKSDCIDLRSSPKNKVEFYVMEKGEGK